MALLPYCIILLQGYANLALRNDTWFSYLSLSALVREGQEKETELMEHAGCMPTTAKLQFVKKKKTASASVAIYAHFGPNGSWGKW